MKHSFSQRRLRTLHDGNLERRDERACTFTTFDQLRLRCSTMARSPSLLRPGARARAFVRASRAGLSESFSDRQTEFVASSTRPAERGISRPALSVEHADGSSVLHLACAGTGSARQAGDPGLRDLRRAPDEARAPRSCSSMGRRPRVRLLYTIFADHPVVARSVRNRNAGTARVTLRCAMSASLDLPDSRWDMPQLPARGGDACRPGALAPGGWR